MTLPAISHDVPESGQSSADAPLSSRHRILPFTESAHGRRWWCVLGILLLGAYFRIGVGFNWDERHLLHPDERFLTMVSSAIEIPGSLTRYFDTANSPLNPHNKNYNLFVYGTFPLFLTKVIAVMLDADHYGSVQLVGRALSTAFDLGNIVLVYLLGCVLGFPWGGVIGALLLACCVLHIQLSHFFGVEPAVAFFVTLSFILSAHAWRHQPTRLQRALGGRQLLLTAGAGVTFGLALASKISAVFLAPILAVLGMVKLWQARPRWSLETRMNPGKFLGGIVAMVAPGTIFAVCAFVVFRVAQPYAFESFALFTPNPKWIANMREVSYLMSGADFPPSIYWVKRSIFYSTWHLLQWWWGYLPGIAAFAGAVGLVVYGGHTRRLVPVLAVAWAALWFGYQSTQFVKAGRYLSMVYPFFAAFAGIAIFAAARSLAVVFGARDERRMTRVVAATILVACVPTFLWATAFTNIYRDPHSRIAASRWIFKNIPCGTTVANEHWDDALPMRIDGKDSFGRCYNGVEFNHYWLDDRKKLADTVSKLERTDYIFLTSNRLYGAIPRMPRRFPWTSEYYRMLFSGELGFDLVQTFTSYPHLGPIEFNTDRSEEIFTVYDHPKVLIFKKAPRFDAEKIRERFQSFPQGIQEPLTK